MDEENIKVTIEEFQESFDVVLNYLTPLAKLNSERTGTKLINCYASLIKKQLKNRIGQSPLEAENDGRNKLWGTETVFFILEDGLPPEPIAAGEKEFCRGFEAIKDLVQAYAKDVHADDDFNFEDHPVLTDGNLRRRLGGMRPAISKGGGFATTRLFYQIGLQKYGCHIRISREGVDTPPIINIDDWNN